MEARQKKSPAEQRGGRAAVRGEEGQEQGPEGGTWHPCNFS